MKTRIRTIKPEFWESEKMASVSPEACLLAIGLLNVADDKGWFYWHEKLIDAAIFPLRKLKASVAKLLDELSQIGYIAKHQGSDGKFYGLVVNFTVHQRVNRPSDSKIQVLTEDSLRTHGVITEGSLPEPGTGNGEQGTGKGEAQSAGGEVLSGTIPFDDFWAVYTKRTNKKAATAAWAKLTDDKRQAAIDGAVAFCKGKEAQFIAHPTTYLNGERWTDEEPAQQMPEGHEHDLGTDPDRLTPEFLDWLHRDHWRNENAG